MAATAVRAPLGYKKLVPLNREAHATLGLGTPSHLWCAALNAVHLNAAEFASAAASFPIAFARDDNTGEFVPMAVLGLRSAENLFVDGKGQWLPRSYVPAYVRRYPFCIAEIPDREGRPPQRLVCFEDGQLQASGEPLFDAGGKATPLWDNTQRLLEAIEASRQQTRVLCKRLESLGLFTAFEALALPRLGKRMRLQGLFRVDEEKMNAIPGKDLRVMLRKGELKATYAHLISLENFAVLMELAVERDALTPAG
ncbi:MAG: SapC family protein [Stagnimonas sp.]|nr:SapC family protein [Stagnimonas sp.]